MKDFLIYFFGKGDEVEFANFTFAHFAPILLMFVVILLIFRFREKLRTCKKEETIRYVLAFMMIISEMSYFWLFSGTIFALITPTVITYTGPTRYRYYQFWLEHTLGYVSIFYMINVHGMRPTIKSAVKSYVALIVLALIAYMANDMIGPGANYLFLAKAEDTPSILDILPPNHGLRIAIMAAAITVMFALSYLPWLLRDRKERKLREKAMAN